MRTSRGLRYSHSSATESAISAYSGRADGSERSIQTTNQVWGSQPGPVVIRSSVPPELTCGLPGKSGRFSSMLTIRSLPTQWPQYVVCSSFRLGDECNPGSLTTVRQD